MIATHLLPWGYKIYRLFWIAIDWVFPPQCVKCGVSGYRLCPDCFNQIKRIDHDQVCSQCGIPFVSLNRPSENICPTCQENPMPINQIRSWAIYQEPLRTAIHVLKYHRNLALGDYFAPGLLQVLSSQDWTIDLIVPVPLSPKRYRQRGYNQATILATPLALAVQKPLITQALIKHLETRSQVGYSAAERQENVRGAFKADSRYVSGRRVLLIDDVMTTGATLNACAESLFNAGARAVYGLTLARALSHADDQL